MKQNPNFLAFTLAYNGIAPQLITDIKISAAFDLAKPPSVPPPIVDCKALWDTGASQCVVSQKFVISLGLTSVGSGVVRHAGGSSSCNRYMLNFYLPNRVAFPGIMVSECDIADNFDVIIGMDIITSGDFSLTNVGGKTLFSFRFPSMESVDFVKKHNTLMSAATRPNNLCFCGSGKKLKKCHGARA
jgi:hypothetical protein